ncbi:MULTISPECIES: multidrug effflux MFS transporter [Rhizobium/Agrobacterium group]|uniref:Bcr/CflA family efflux transporter n=1 Tax=Neorhizobium petrolearium TaxID=515361 RepID=A0ABY8M6N2_9HYPH|nr:MULTISPECIES: multidrug effflux MFS transporter [Rhizobium/Agrobacterium group]KGD94474.1 multidrug MFS transporter [Rhizobium sp. YS-1r]MCC2610008.1 multidrug effflux MFS transporter [Neorhizobium petrolearium]WGI70187.1 multidrug effflux MFS transporter [Neorhizobium petrolearium]
MQQSRFLDRQTPPHILTLVVCAGLGALSLNVFLPSLSAMAIHFGTDYAVMQLAVSGYIAGTALLQLVLGPLSDIFGRRRVMIGSILILLVGTLICLAAPNVTVFMFGRMLQTAVVAGFVLPRAIIRDTVPMESAASMIAYVTMGMSLVPMIAPTIGGTLSDLFGWEANFVLILGLGLITLILVSVDLGETNRTPAASFTAQFRSWPDLFRSRRFWGYTLTSTFSSGVFFSFLGGAPFVGTAIYHLTPTMLGVQFFLIAAGYMVGNFISGRYTRRFGTMTMMISGSVVSLIGVCITTAILLGDVASATAFFAPLALTGVGNGLTLPSSNAGIVSVRPHLAGSASGLGGAITVGGGAALSTLAAAVLKEEGGAIPLLVVMGISTLLALAATAYVRRIDLREGAIETRDADR